ncbi:EamA family transporter [Paracidobacterium acidisoli]|uniref:EamA domain-containing protein n=1 Tax=Paracidobacterium acidisoli TaxID=2303751 RepID=A0A372IPF3_9BACT|nr:EamA family transporter [Paracidobacterium acidisoli]MBT9331093.1 EamA family transporter [Paracidobacterium acidisoli]
MPIRRVLAYAAIYVLWGGSFLGIREVVAMVPPFFAAGFRFLLAGLVLIAWSYVRGGTARVETDRRRTRNACLLGVPMFMVMYAALFWGEVRVASGIAAVISAVIPVWIFLGEVWVLRTQRATLLSVLGVALGFGGVAVLALYTPGGPGRSPLAAMLVLIGGTISWSVGTLWSRRLKLPRPQTLNAGWQMACGGTLLLVLAAVTGELRGFPPVSQWLTVRVVAGMAYLVIAASIVTFTCYVWLIAHEPATRVASYAYVNPVFALLAGAALAGERLSAPQMAGAALVVAGVFATLTGKQAMPATREQPVRGS